MTVDCEGAFRIYREASEYVARAGLSAEVAWQREAVFDEFTESDLLRESAWVILCSGFREATVRQMFGNLSLCFCDWESAEAIGNKREACKNSALRIFRHTSKLDSIVAVADRINATGFASWKKMIILDPLSELQTLPYIGAITVLHLAKNLGLNVAKPDRHLARVSRYLGFANASDLCAVVGERFDQETKVVDLVLWRFLADNPYLRKEWAPLSGGQRSVKRA